MFSITKETKQEQEEREVALLEELGIDLVVMARYMQRMNPCRYHHFTAERTG